MTDIDRVFRDIDQKHQVYTKKFGLIKARCDGLQGEIDELRALIAAANIADAVITRPLRKKRAP